MQMSWGYAIPLILEAAVRNRVFDVLDDRPKTLEEASRETGASKRGLRAIMDALVGFEFLARDGERYALTPESAAFLVSTKPGYQGAFLKHISVQLIPRWLNLSETVRTGKPAAAVESEEAGVAFFEQFVESLFPMSYAATQVLGEHLGLPTATGEVRVLDVAAGSGVWGIGLAQMSEHVRVTAQDWSRILGVTQQMAQRVGVAGQMSFLAGDLREVDFGGPFDIATLGHILHSEGDEASRRLLGKVFKALAPGGTIVISEFVVDEDRRGPPGPLIFAVNMLVNTDRGDAFTFSQIRSWLEEVGFRSVRQLEAPAPSPLILATRPA
jgi:ubiquinone/menaquinone biosynthesis C-methylase UbiE